MKRNILSSLLKWKCYSEGRNEYSCTLTCFSSYFKVKKLKGVLLLVFFYFCRLKTSSLRVKSPNTGVENCPISTHQPSQLQRSYIYRYIKGTPIIYG